MAITCKCPAAASLETIPAVVCTESFGQIQKVAFQRLTKDDGSKNSFTADAAITLLAFCIIAIIVSVIVVTKFIRESKLR